MSDYISTRDLAEITGIPRSTLRNNIKLLKQMLKYAGEHDKV